ncbi:MAG: methylenetetrahydrofolate--tRNA-(uracil(54)-C(5))-methyltransferase (FADH(2)-oxidizing) TrmFO [Coriobacteriia bacterium]|nr:methylenetetrahydrofolate--tRNA-(uracil(54)-C(5))-methyltransferase (FADH(2)-oxidizing) TrmFO [Coriobacteriia bacterium]
MTETGHDGQQVLIVGAGLAGCEAALQLANRGVSVRLFEMRPQLSSPAHHSDYCAELVCSNSFKSDDEERAAGTLKRELTLLGSRLLQHAYAQRVPAGSALAVDRKQFSRAVHAEVTTHPLIEFVQTEITHLDSEPTPGQLTIVAAGPLASDGLAASLRSLTGADSLSFYDAAAPIVSKESLNPNRVFAASRYGKGAGDDYLNCALDQDEYCAFYEALVTAQRVTEKDFERKELFAACQPIEEVARSGFDALRYGALKPVGIDDPRTGRYPYALVQLRKETAQGKLYNLVGFQTNLRFGEQQRVFSLIPGLEQVDIVRYGVMHRNTFVDAPRVLSPDFSLQRAPHIHLAGQICGTEGYLEAVGSGLLCALNVYAKLQHSGDAATSHPVTLPPESVLGALLAYSNDSSVSDYQPMHVNFGLLPPLSPPVRNKRSRYAAYSTRAQAATGDWIAANRDRLFSHV